MEYAALGFRRGVVVPSGLPSPRSAVPVRALDPAVEACRRADREFVDALIEHAKAEKRLDAARRDRRIKRAVLENR
jgi:hypothetical protein